MGQSELQTAYKNWAKRVAQYTALGIPSTAYSPIAQADMHKVATDQGGAMTNEQAAAAVYAAASKTNPIQATQAQAQRHHGGLFGGLEDFVGNIGSDVGHIITGAPAGIAHLGASLVTPGGWKHTGHDLASAAHDIGQGDLGKALRDAAQVPAIDLIPGVADVAALTTKAGREQLLTHPVTTALDVMPFTKPLTAAAGMTLAARAGAGVSDTLTEALGQASSWDKIRGKVDVRSEDPTALAAAASGRPVQAGLRLIDRPAANRIGTKLGEADAMQGGRLSEFMVRAGTAGPKGELLGPGQYAWQQAGMATGMSRAAKGIATQVMREQSVITQRLQTFAHQIAGQLGVDVSHEKLAEYTQKIAEGDRQGLDQVGRTLYDRYAIYRQAEEARRIRLGEGKDIPGLGFYST